MLPVPVILKDPEGFIDYDAEADINFPFTIKKGDKIIYEGNEYTVEFSVKFINRYGIYGVYSHENILYHLDLGMYHDNHKYLHYTNINSPNYISLNLPKNDWNLIEIYRNGIQIHLPLS